MRKICCFILFFVLNALIQAGATIIAVEKPAEFNLSKTEETILFELTHPGDRMLALAVEFVGNAGPEAGIRIEGTNVVTSGPVTWNGIFDREVFAHDGPVSIVDNIKPMPGKLQLKLIALSAPVSGKVRVIDLGPVEKIEYSEKTGAIQIRKPDNSAIIALGDVSHPDFQSSSSEFYGSVTADGDLLIPVPVGFYTLTQSSPLVSSVQARMIPVQPGKITIIENWPKTPQPDADEDSEKVAAAIASGTMQVERELKIRSVKLLDGGKVSVRFATPNWQGVVKKEELEAQEGGMKAEVISAGPVASPLHLTILLDSSGSMKNDMKQALTSVEQFIKLLPADSEIVLVDFDSKTREVKAKDRASLIKGLKAVKADGATCLNDSVMTGLQKSAGKGRPAILLFTDGFDANHNDTGPGSTTKPEEMFEAVKAAEVPVFTIGFGKKPDEATLRRLATLSGASYNKADKDNIAKVFAEVASILGREHEMVYRRPGIRGNSDAPVISVVIDTSGSMGMPPSEEGCDYRLEKAKAILRDLFGKLPQDSIVQLMSYHMYMDVQQTFTANRSQLLTGLSQLKAYGGTATLEALYASFKMLNEIPTDRKYLLFITDAGLELDPAAISPDYEAILGSLKDAGIQTTWIGMVDEAQKAPFDVAAKLCNGKAVVSTDLAAVREAVENFGRTLVAASATGDARTPVQLTFTHRDDKSRLMIMSSSEKAQLPPSPIVATATVNGLKLTYADMPQQLERYSLELSQSLYGTSQTRDETLITQRMPMNAGAGNAAMRLSVLEVLMMEKFRGINQPCVALKLRFENILPEQEVTEDAGTHPASVVSGTGPAGKTVRKIPPYQIGDVRMHFFAKFNQLEAVPVSDLSWVVEDPLITPEDESLTISAGEAIEGWLVFDYGDSGSLSRASLTFYDNNNGNLHIPLIGSEESAKEEAAFEKLPAGVEGDISTAFKLRLAGSGDRQMPEPMQDYLMRTVDLRVISQVQALLDIDPVERLTMLLPTRFGDLVIAPSPRTAMLPMGWHRPVMFLPGSDNHLRQAYLLPKTLGGTRGILRVDVAGGEILLACGSGQVKAEKPLAAGKGDKISLSINAFSRDGANLFLDMTLVDEKDGEGTAISIAELCRIEAGGETFVPETGNHEYMFQASEQVETADGHSHRFLLVISLPEGTDGAVLKSDLFGIDLPLGSSNAGKLDDYMLTAADSWSSKNSEENPIKTMATAIQAERAARGWKKKGAAESVKTPMQMGQACVASGAATLPEEGMVLIAPDFRDAVASESEALLKMNATDFIQTLRGIRCVLPEKCSTLPVYAPEAVLMQKWGTPNDLLELARYYYKSTGSIVANGCKLATLTEKGKDALLQLTGWKSDISQLPVLAVGGRNLVFPFIRDVTELSGLVEPELAEEAEDVLNCVAGIKISLKVKPRNSGQAAQMGSMGDALGGGSDASDLFELPLFESGPLDFATLSRSPLDFFYFTPDGGSTLAVSAEGAAGKLENLVEPFSLADNEVIEEVIQIKLGEQELSYTRPVEKGMAIVDTFRTMALCMPDQTASAAIALSDRFSSLKTPDAPGTRSTARWFTRSKIYQFLALHSEAEAEAVRCTGVKTGRPGERMRAVILTLSKVKGSLHAVFDLRQINPVVQGEEKAIQAFNFFMGIANTMIEHQVMGGGSLFSRWLGGDKQKMMVVGPDEIATLIEGLDTESLPEQTITLLQQAADNHKGVIFPTMAPVVDGKPRAGWFVFDPVTYEMNSVLDNGSHGSMVEKPITEIISDASKYAVGFLIGTNVSLWSVVAYSIKYSDMRQVVKAAKDLSLQIAEHIKDVGKPLRELLPEIPDSYTGHEVEASAGPVSVKVGFANLSADGFKLMTKPSINFNFSYQSGFEDAVNLYFKGN